VTETHDSREIAALVAAWLRSPTASTRELQQLIGRWCAEATAHGIPVARQLEMLAVHGIHPGGGGGGAGLPAARCAYCGAYGGGGHGGLCPLGSAGIDGEQGLSGGGMPPPAEPPAWVRDAAEIISYRARTALQEMMRLNGEDPGSPPAWGARWGQLTALLDGGRGGRQE